MARGDPGDALLEHARGTEALVLGNSHRGGVTGTRLGSVGLHWVYHATVAGRG